MKSHTTNLKNRITIAGDLKSGLDVLRDAYKGQRGWLLTCGPSIKDHDPQLLQDRIRDDVVISVKQTLDLIGGCADFHLLNSWNIQPYNYSSNAPVVLMERGPHDPEVPDIEWDMCFPVTGVDPSIPRDVRLANRLAQRCNFDDYLFDTTLDRPWGPGVVYELGIYLAVHLGLSELIAVGWDIGERNTSKMEHFYDSEKPQVLTKARGFFSHSKKKEEESLYNQPGYYQAEVDVIADSTGACARWLKSKGVSLKVVSDKSLVDSAVPRMTLASKIHGGQPRRSIKRKQSVLLSSADSLGKRPFISELELCLGRNKVRLNEVPPKAALHIPLNQDCKLFDLEIDQLEFASAAAILSRQHSTTELHSCHALSCYLDHMRELIESQKVRAIVLWHQYTACHLALASLAKVRDIPVRFVEHGVLPGTIDWDSRGQMAERAFMADIHAFNHLPISSADRKTAEAYLKMVAGLQLTRKIQPESKGNAKQKIKRAISGKREIFYAGQFDIHTGMVPRWSPRSHIHSPFFASTHDALRHLESSLDPDRYRILFKPHPNGGDDLASKWSGTPSMTRVINKANIFDCLAQCDVVVTVLSQVAYLATIVGRPVVLLGRMPLSGSGAVYEIDHPGQVAEVVQEACDRGLTKSMRSAWVDHVARLLKYESIAIKDEIQPFVSRTVAEVVDGLLNGMNVSAP
jgi:hypothetical protein